MKKRSLLLSAVATLLLSAATKAQNICQTIGNDSIALYNNGYITGPENINCGQNVHTESKWINVTGADSLFVNTFQHRLYDFSKIYDENNNLIWSWLGENAAPTWYFRQHSVFIGGFDSVRIEFHQGYPDPFCNGYMQVVGMSCTPIVTSNICQSIGNDSLALYNNGYITGPENINCGQNVHTESKWINVTGADSLFVNTFQHRLYDFSKIYDENNNLIWSWFGENAAPTWYFRQHSVFIGGFDSVRIEFHQGYPDPFCNGYFQVVGISCQTLTVCANNTNITPQTNFLITGNIATFTATTSDPNPSYLWQSDFGQGFVTLNNYGNYSGVNSSTLTVVDVQLSEHNQPIRVISTSGNCVDTSNIATIQITDTCITNVTVYDTLITTVTDTLIINTTLSLPSPNNENTILIYPNPASDHITIDNGNFTAMAGYSIKITNNSGQEVFLNAINQAQFYVDLSTWTGNGLYFVHLIDSQNNTVTVRKIVLQ